MKTIFLFCLYCICTFAAFGQSNEIQVEPDARLLEVYEESYLTGLQKNNPFLLQRWNFYLNNAYMLGEVAPSKNATYPIVYVDDLTNINILLLEKEQKLAHDFKARTYYQIAGTNKLLIYRSGEEFRDALNKHLGRAYPPKK